MRSLLWPLRLVAAVAIWLLFLLTIVLTWILLVGYWLVTGVRG